MTTDIEIARKATPLPIQKIGAKVNINEDHLISFGKYKAKIDKEFIESVSSKPDGKLILMTALSPTPAGEGKTTTSVGLNDGLNAIGKKSIVCLREPSLGPCFGMKGGAAGGGYAQVIPMEDINLHFTGDFHAIGSAHNLLLALLDNSLYWGNKKNINPRSVDIKRVIDMNDRALREIVASLGKVNGSPREAGFDITVASEVMAIFCLANNMRELTDRLSNITIGMDTDKKRLFAKDLQAEGAMTVLLKDAFLPNLVQTLENNPAIIHGGPFANIAHGCNSVVATKLGLKLADFVVTEAGFGADLGAEKFCDIKCVKSGIKPDVAVIVATIRALKMHGGVPKSELAAENTAAVMKGMANLNRHIENTKLFGIPVVVAINHFVNDTDNELKVVVDECQKMGVETHVCRHWAEGGKGTRSLAEAVCRITENKPSGFKPLYSLEMPLAEKIDVIAKKIYRAGKVNLSNAAKKKIEAYQLEGYGNVPVCMAKTQYSFTVDPAKYGAPENHEIEIKDVILNTGAGFMVAMAGDIMRMPGLPRVPAANTIHIDNAGHVQGLF